MTSPRPSIVREHAPDNEAMLEAVRIARRRPRGEHQPNHASASTEGLIQTESPPRQTEGSGIP